MQAVAVRPAVTYRRKNNSNNYTKAKKRENVRSKTIMNTICLFLFLIGVASFLNLYQRVIIMQNIREIEKITFQIKEEKTSYERNELKLTQLKSPEKIQKIATEKLQMSEAQKLGYIVFPLQANKTITGKEVVKLNNYKFASLLNSFSNKWLPGR